MSNINKIEPLFVRNDTRVSSQKPITHCKIQNGMVLLGLQEKSLQHIRIQTGKFTDIALNLGSEDGINHIFLDHRGLHAIVSTKKGENFYMNMKTVALKPLRKLKGYAITSVGFNAEKVSDQETGFIVLGTSKGHLMETNITSSGQMNYHKTLSQTLFEGAPISAIHVIPYSMDSDMNWLLIICIPGRLYCIPGLLNNEALEYVPSQQVVGTVWSSAFVEQPSAVLQNFFSSKANPRYHSLGDQQTPLPSDVVIYPTSIELLPENYCWLAAEGISAGHFETNKEEGFDIICEDWFKRHEMSEGKFNYPIDVALSEYHAFLVYPDKFVAMSLLEEKVAFEDVFASNMNVLGMCRDSASEFIWIFHEKGLFYYRPDRETRDVWKVLVNRNEFSKARKIAKQMSDKRPYQVVLKKEAEKYLKDQNYVAAAELLAESTEPFENTVLKFLKDSNFRDAKNGLKRYLELKLDALDRRDKVKRDILVIWLLEVQLSELSELKRTSTNVQEDVTLSPVHKESLSKKLREQLYCFLHRTVVNECIIDNKQAVYRLITSHVDFDTYLYLSNKLKDYEVMVKVNLLQNNFEEALEVATSQPDLIYKYSQEFFDNIPQALIKTLITLGSTIKPSSIISAFFKCNISPEHVASTFIYLNFLVQKNVADQSTHNFLIKLMVEHKPNQLLSHLKKYGQNKDSAQYDVDRALRLCLEKNLVECSVYLYCLEGLYEKAVELALTINIELAKECAKELDNDDTTDFSLFNDLGYNNFGSAKISRETKQHVWLTIAKHMITNKFAVAECTALIHESNNVIKITDILPFFPEFTKMSHFKKLICDILNDHSKGIQQLQREIVAATEGTNHLKEQIEKNQVNIIVCKSTEKCAKCDQRILQQAFVPFSCRHFFHLRCLTTHMIEVFSEPELKLYEKMKEHEKSLKAEVLIKDGDERTNAEVNLNRLKSKTNNFLCRECPYCSTRVIQLLKTPLISEEDYNTQSAEWLL